MKKGLKKGYIGLGVFSGILAGVTLGFFLFQIFSPVAEITAIGYQAILDQWKAVFTLKAEGGLVESIVSFGILALGLVMMIVTGVCVKDRKAKAGGAILSAILMVMSSFYYPYIVKYVMGFIATPALPSGLAKILEFAWVIVAVLFVIFMIIAIAVAAAQTKKNARFLAEQAVEEEALETVEGEANEEGAEAVAAVAAPVVEDAEEDDTLVEEFVEEPIPCCCASNIEKEPAIDAASLANMIRDIVREELSKNQPSNSSVVGATFSSPLIIQYFNGVTPSTPAASNEDVKVKDAPAPAPAPAASAPVVEEPVEDKAAIVRIPFGERLLSAEKEMKDNYNELKNEILSYGVKSRISSSGDTFRLHCKTYVRISVAGKSLKLRLALDPEDYKDSTIPVIDDGEKNAFAEIPLAFKVKSPLSLRRAKQLIKDAMDKDGIAQGEVGKVNWVKELKADMAAAAADKED